MKYFHLLTAILFLLKVLNIAQVSWLIVFLPSIISLTLGLILFIIGIILTIIASK